SDDQEPKRSANEETARWVPLSSVLETLSYENLRSYFASFIAPLFIKTRKRKPLVVDVIFSKTEPYLSGTKQLVESIDTCGARGRYFELNQLAEKQKFSEKNRVIYFLTNDPDAQNAAFWMQDAQKCYVINAEYLRLWHSKSIVQALLKKHGVPILPSTPSLTNQNYAKKSFIIKGEYHGSRDEALLKNNANHHPWRVYSERRMQDKRFTEIKIGYVAGQLLAETPGMHFSQALRSALHRIYAHLGLEIFSVDLFISGTGAFYIIDVNPAPAFFHNAAARKSFGTYTKAISSLGAF
ncbi:MAG: hypothetical protein Q7R83_01120, partial [bacterium]|nr:hypothetical protein [bacterium]